jgi:hypothetical protein
MLYHGDQRGHDRTPMPDSEPCAPAPQPPFSTWPVQFFVPNVGFYWYATPAAFVSHALCRHGTVEMVDAHNDLLDEVLAARNAEIQRAGGILIFSDWRSISTFAPGARSRQQERMRRRGRGYARRTIIVVNPANRLMRMAAEASNLFTTLVFQARLEVALSPDAPLASAGLTPPRAGELFPKDAASSGRPRRTSDVA